MSIYVLNAPSVVRTDLSMSMHLPWDYESVAYVTDRIPIAFLCKKNLPLVHLVKEGDI